MANVFMIHGHVTAGVTVQTVLMKLIVAAVAVAMANLHVMMAVVFMIHGHVMAMVIVQMAQMNLMISVVRLLIHVLMTIVMKAHIGMAILAMVVTIV